MSRSRHARRIEGIRKYVLVPGLGVFLVVIPMSVRGQDSDLPSDAVYLAATDSLLGLSPSALLDSYVCDRNWRNVYDLPIRCGATGVARRVLRPVAETLAVPLEADPRGCEVAVEDRSLQLSPVQFVSSSSAWFVAALVCDGPAGSLAELRVFDFRLQGSDWMLERVQVLPSSTELHANAVSGRMDVRSASIER